MVIFHSFLYVYQRVQYVTGSHEHVFPSSLEGTILQSVSCLSQNRDTGHSKLQNLGVLQPALPANTKHYPKKSWFSRGFTHFWAHKMVVLIINGGRK